MPLPNNMTTVWAVGTFIDSAGAPLRGCVRFKPSVSVLVNPAADRVVKVITVTAALNDAGYFAAQLIASGDEDVAPSTVAYQVTEPTGRSYTLTLPADAPILDDPSHPLHGQRVIDLASAVPAAAAGGGTGLLLRGVGVASMTVDDGSNGLHLLVTYTDGSTAAIPLPAGVASVNGRAGQVTGLAEQAALNAHTSGTTGVHGIPDTSALVTSSSLAGAVTAHAAASDPHGDRAWAVSAIADALAEQRDALIYDARNHGVVGNWVSAASPGTNDRAALQTLVNDLNTAFVADGRPRVIYCPPGDYSVRDSGIVWKSGVSLLGAGPGLTRFHLANPVNTTNPTPLAAYTADFHGASPSTPLVDCTFAEFEVDGAGVTISPYTTGPKAFVLQYMLRGRFHNLYLHDCGATALGCDYLQDTIISNVVAENNGRLNDGSQPGGAGIGIGIGGWGEVERTTIIGCTAVGNGAHGIFVELQDNSFPRPKGIRIIGCHVEGNRRGISDWGADGLVVSGCTIVGNTGEGFNVCGEGVAGFAGRDGILTNCVIDDNGADGVLIGDTPGGYTVRGNRVSNNAGHGIHLASTTQSSAFAVSGFAAVDNDVFANALAGIRTDCVMTDGFITGNRIRSNGTNTGAASSGLRAGISFNAAANSPTVTNNRVWDNQGTKTQTYGWFITAAGTAGSAVALFNNLNGNLTGAYSSAGSVTGGIWSHNLGAAAGATSSAQTALIDGNTYANGNLRWKAQQRVWNSGTLTPSASANTNGTPAVCSPSSGQLGLTGVIMARAVFAGTFASETATVTFTATFSDATTAAATVTATATGTQVVASGGLLSLAKDGLYVTQVSVALKSTIASSAVTAAVDILATQN